MNGFPDGWASTTLGDVATYWNGRAFKESEWRRAGLPIVRIQNLNNPSAPYNYSDVDHEQRYKAKKGDLLVAWAASLGAHIWRGNDAWVNQHIFRVEPHSDIIRKQYLYYAIKDSIERLLEKSHGSGIVHVTKGTFESHEIRLPPLAEQARIEGKLDAVLARVASCSERLDRMPTILKKFREAVLDAAVCGKLTEEWRGGPPSWRVAYLGDVLTEKPRNGYSPRSVEYETNVKSLTLTATTSGRFIGDHFKYLDVEIPTKSHLWLQPGDILIQRANTIEYVGVSAVYEGPPAGYIYPDLMMKCRANEQVETKFLHCLLLSGAVRGYFREHATGTAGNMPKINQKTVISARVPLPPLPEQREIARRVDELFALADGLEHRYRAVVERIKKVTPAALAKAFRGELVPQNPNDEPATMLLERFRVRTETGADALARRVAADGRIQSDKRIGKTRHG